MRAEISFSVSRIQTRSATLRAPRTLSTAHWQRQAWSMTKVRIRTAATVRTFRVNVRKPGSTWNMRKNLWKKVRLTTASVPRSA